MRRQITRWVTGADAIPPLGPIAWAGLGAAAAIACVAWLYQNEGSPWLLGSFGASCVLLFGFPEAPFSQTRNLFTGHLLCSLIGLMFLAWTGPVWWGLALALSTALMVMLLTRTVHPPAGSNPVIIFMTQPDWYFLLFPTLAGVILLWLAARLYAKTRRRACS